MASELVRTLETRYIYSAEEASQKVKNTRGYVHVSMESQLDAKGKKRWRVVGYRYKNEKPTRGRLVPFPTKKPRHLGGVGRGHKR